jgi:hypothetical protein
MESADSGAVEGAGKLILPFFAEAKEDAYSAFFQA